MSDTINFTKEELTPAQGMAECIVDCHLSDLRSRLLKPIERILVDEAIKTKERDACRREVKRLRSALTSILGWREHDRDSLSESLAWIEDLARYALDEKHGLANE